MIRLLSVLLLAGCAAQVGPSAIALRDRSAPVASVVGVDSAALAGRWQVIEGAGIARGDRVDGAAKGLTVRGKRFVRTADGRYSNGSQQLWLHWIAQDGEAAALGDPAGGLVFIMARDGQMRPDRLAAAHTILDWYGYDLAAMQAR